MKSTLSVLGFAVITFYSLVTFSGQYLFESDMPYQRGSCVDFDRIVIMNSTIDVNLPVSLDSKTWTTTQVLKDQKKVFIAAEQISPKSTGTRKIDMNIFINLGTHYTLEGGQIYELTSTNGVLSINRIPTTCQSGKLRLVN